MSSQSVYNTHQLRGAFSAGFEAGEKQGADRMASIGFRRIKSTDELAIGDTIKLLTPTIAGWIGVGKVLDIQGDGILMSKLAPLSVNDEGTVRTADVGVNEIAKMYNLPL